MQTVIISPAYGRDYRKAEDALLHYEEGADFKLETIDGIPRAGYCSARDFPPDLFEVRIRFNSSQSVAIVPGISGAHH